jgi:hypothetical protein
MKWLVASLALIAVAGSRDATAQPPPSAGAAVIGEVAGLRVIGNQRTRSPVILDAAGIAIGDRFEPGMAEVIEQRVLNLRLFRAVEVSASARGAEVDVAIQVVERWTLLPIPFVAGSSRGMRGGAYLLESNLLGWNKLVVLGAIYSGGEGPSAFALYRDPSVAGTRGLFRAMARYGDLLREQYRGADRVYAYRDGRVDLSASGGYAVTPWLSLFAGAYAVPAWSESVEGEAAPPANGTVFGWSGELELRAQDFHLYFNEGIGGRLSYRQAREDLGAERDVLELSALVQVARPVFGDQSIAVTGQAWWHRGDAVLDAVLMGGLPGSRGFERLGLWAERAASVVVEHQVPVFRTSWGIWTANTFAEAGASEWRARRDGHVTPGVGFRLYLLGVAFPALGVDAAYSLDDDRVLGMASFGFSQ